MGRVGRRKVGKLYIYFAQKLVIGETPILGDEVQNRGGNHPHPALPLQWLSRAHT